MSSLYGCRRPIFSCGMLSFLHFFKALASWDMVMALHWHPPNRSHPPWQRMLHLCRIQRMIAGMTKITCYSAAYYPPNFIKICVELATTKKRDLSADDYFYKIKNLADEMATADAALHDDEIVAYLLAGLGIDYDPFVTSMTTKSEHLTLYEVYGDLVSYEARQLQHQADARLHIGNTANYASRGSTLAQGGVVVVAVHLMLPLVGHPVVACLPVMVVV
jgi:hypothetical protein